MFTIPTPDLQRGPDCPAVWCTCDTTNPGPETRNNKRYQQAMLPSNPKLIDGVAAASAYLVAFSRHRGSELHLRHPDKTESSGRDIRKSCAKNTPSQAHHQ